MESHVGLILTQHFKHIASSQEKMSVVQENI